MNVKKTIIHILTLAILLCITLTFGAGFASADSEIVDSGECGKFLTWTLNSDGLLIISGEGEMYNLKSNIEDLEDKETEIYDVPELDYISWDEDELWHWWDWDEIKNVIIENGVETIGNGAFFKCKNLNSIIIPDTVKGIFNHAFYDCCNLASITIPENVTAIGEDAFAGCAFQNAGPIGSGCDYEFGWEEKIPSYAFSGCYKMTNVTIPESVTSIGEWAFSNCESLEEITIPDNVASIGMGAFENCKSLKEIIIPKSITSIEGRTFEDCINLGSIIIPESVTSIGSEAFQFCESLKRITVPGSVTSIKEDAFYHCAFQSAGPIGSGCDYEFEWEEKIPANAFEGCFKLTNITIPNSVTKIGESAFSFCESLKGITIPESVTNIGRYAFYSCKNLNEIIIPKSVTKIRGCTFSKCESLKEITVPEGVTSIEFNAFSKCYGLKAIVIPESLNFIYSNAFDFISEDAFFYVYKDSYAHTWLKEKGVESIRYYNSPEFDPVTDSEKYLYDKDIKVKGIKSIEYNGKPVTQKNVNVYINNKKLKKGEDYLIAYKNNEEVGEASVILSGINDHLWTINKTFKIIPKGTSIKHIKAQKKSFRL